MKTLSYAALSFSFLLCAAACKQKPETDKEYEEKESFADYVYVDYLISGEEDNPEVTIRAQYHLGDENGRNIPLLEGYGIALNGENPLEIDSTVVTGIYYETQVEKDSFTGNHELVLTTAAGKKYIETFAFDPLSFAEEPNEKISKKGVTWQLSGVNDREKVRVLMTDTVFGSMGVDIEKIVEGGILEIPAEAMASLKKGPIAFELYKEMEKPLENGGEAGGRVVVRHAVRRAFTLTD